MNSTKRILPDYQIRKLKEQLKNQYVSYDDSDDDIDKYENMIDEIVNKDDITYIYDMTYDDLNKEYDKTKSLIEVTNEEIKQYYEIIKERKDYLDHLYEKQNNIKKQQIIQKQQIKIQNKSLSVKDLNKLLFEQNSNTSTNEKIKSAWKTLEKYNIPNINKLQILSSHPGHFVILGACSGSLRNPHWLVKR